MLEGRAGGREPANADLDAGLHVLAAMRTGAVPDRPERSLPLDVDVRPDRPSLRGNRLDDEIADLERAQVQDADVGLEMDDTQLAATRATDFCREIVHLRHSQGLNKSPIQVGAWSLTKL